MSEPFRQCAGHWHVVGSQKLFGHAFTVKYCPIDVNLPGIVGDYVDNVKPGEVVVPGRHREADGWVLIAKSAAP